MEFNSITVVGGGSSGWMTASTLLKAFPNKKISIIESPDYPIVGVGESTLMDIKWWTHFLEIDDHDIMPFCDASYKMSIKFTDFYKENDGGFHYPFVYYPYLQDTRDGLQDWLFKKSLYPDTPVQDFVRTYVPHSALFENNKISYDPYGKFDGFNFERDVAYNFDATKFGLWLKEFYCIPRGINLIQDTVVDATISDDGIDSLILNSGNIHSADLYIDCTGFSSILIGKHMNEEFISYEDLLPNNRAWAARVPYKNKDIEMEPFANSTAIQNGWCWNLPLWSRLGTGYVYSDKYVSPEDALREFKDYLMSNKIVIPRSQDEVDSLEFKDVRFRVGIHKRIWVKNVVAIGLSAGFIEPLESNGLWTVQAFLFQVLRALSKEAITQFDIDTVNTHARRSFNNFAEFIALHYALSIREDTKYWKDINRKTFNEKMINLVPEIANGTSFLQYSKTETHTLDINSGITWISIGMNYFLLDKFDQDILQFRVRLDHKTMYDQYFKKAEENKKRWQLASENELTHYRFLQKHIYGGKE